MLAVGLLCVVLAGVSPWPRHMSLQCLQHMALWTTQASNTHILVRLCCQHTCAYEAAMSYVLFNTCLFRLPVQGPVDHFMSECFR